MRGFSLVELMIVVAIMGILAAVAIPAFSSMQLRAKRSEILTNVAGIKTAEEAYDAAHDSFVPAASHPSETMGKQQHPWGDEVPGFDTLGWRPDGDVRGQYAIQVSEDEQDFEVIGQSDVDEDAHYADARATLYEEVHLTTANDVY